MRDESRLQNLSQSVQRYFDLMYDSDVSRFEHVFRASAQLHGFRDGRMTVWSAAQFRDLLAGRPSPQSLNAPRQEEVLLVDFASPTQALVKVRVRINTIVFVDYLTFHLIDEDWLITSKAFHVESTVPAA
jgi:putative lumazine-binding protein